MVNKEHSREVRRLEQELAIAQQAALRVQEESSKKKSKGSDESIELKEELKVPSSRTRLRSVARQGLELHFPLAHMPISHRHNPK